MPFAVRICSLQFPCKLSLPSRSRIVDMSPVTIKVLGTIGLILILSGTEGITSQEARSTGDVPSSESILLSYGFPVLSELTYLCQERVYADQGDGNRHITWHAFSSALEPKEVIKLLRQQLGDAGFNPEDSGGTWRFPVGSKSPDRVLTVLSVEKQGPHSNCKEQIPSTARSILIVSRRR